MTGDIILNTWAVESALDLVGCLLNAHVTTIMDPWATSIIYVLKGAGTITCFTGLPLIIDVWVLVNSVKYPALFLKGDRCLAFQLCITTIPILLQALILRLHFNQLFSVYTGTL